MTEQDAMRRALELALRGWGRVHPNPLVGAVVLRNGKVVGEGFHAEFGQPHAEAIALEAAGDRARGGTLVVTLEPCRHVGKQPPCTDAVIRSGVSRVVIAVEDPHPEAGGGAERLKEAGLDVDIGCCRAEAAAQNAMFLHRYRRTDRPFVALKLATSLDARIADASGNSRWISGPEARDFVHWLRAGFDAIGVGAATARRDDPALTVRGPVSPRIPPARVIFTQGGALPDLSAIQARGVSPLILAQAGHSASVALPPDVRLVLGDSLAELLAALRSQGIGSILVEGGGGLAGALLEHDLVDRYYWIQSPFWLGGGTGACAGLSPQSLGRVPRWYPVERRALGDDTLLVVDRG